MKRIKSQQKLLKTISEELVSKTVISIRILFHFWKSSTTLQQQLSSFGLVENTTRFYPFLSHPRISYLARKINSWTFKGIKVSFKGSEKSTSRLHETYLVSVNHWWNKLACLANSLRNLSFSSWRKASLANSPSRSSMIFCKFFQVSSKASMVNQV